MSTPPNNKQLLICLLGTIVGLWSCGRRGGQTVSNPDTYTFLAPSDIDSVDPAWANDVWSQSVILQVYEPLLLYKGASMTELIPLLAERVPSRANALISNDGRTYRFPIRQGVLFRDGTPLEPEDVKYSILRFCLQDRDGGPSRVLLEPILGYTSTRERGRLQDSAFKELDGAVRLDGNEVVIRLKEPFEPFLSILAVMCPIISKEWAAANGDWDGREETWARYNNPKREDSPFFGRANGTGPFALETWSRETRTIRLARNDRYWRRPSALKRVVLSVVPEFSTRKLMLAAGDADAIYADRSNLKELAGLDGVAVTGGLSTVKTSPVVFFNFRANPKGNPFIGSGKLDGQGVPPDFFRDTDVRQGFAHALDYRALLQDLWGGAERANGCVPKGLLGYDPSLPGHSFDLQRAEKHFKKAWDGKVWREGFSIVAAYNEGNQDRKALLDALKRAVEGLNPRFRMDVRGLQWSTYLSSIEAGKLPLFVLGSAADYPDPHFFAFNFLHSRGLYSQRQGFSDPHLDALIERAKLERNHKKRARLYVQAQQLAQSLTPHIYVAHQTEIRVQRDWVKGWQHNPMFPGSPHGTYLYPIRKE